MAATLDTIRVARTTYLVEPATPADARDIPVRFILHHPRGPKYLLVPEPGHPDYLIAIVPMTPFDRFRQPPRSLDRARFAVDGGRLAVVA